MTGKELRGRVDDFTETLDWVEDFVEGNDDALEAVDRIRDDLEILSSAVPLE